MVNFILALLLNVSVCFAAAYPAPIKGTLRSYDKTMAKIINLNGTYHVPIEYFSDVKKISIGSEVELNLDDTQFKKIKFEPPQEVELKRKSDSK